MCINTGEEVFWPNLIEEDKICTERQISVNITGTHSKSCFFYPLMIDGKPGGVISVQSQNENGLPAMYLDALRALGNHLSVAIKNIRLKEEETIRRQEAEALHQATRAINKSIEPNTVIQQILKAMRSVVPFDYATVQLLQKDGVKQVFKVIDGTGFPEMDKMIGSTFPIDARESYRRVYKKKHTVIINEIKELADSPNNQFNTPADIKSWMGVPLLVDRRSEWHHYSKFENKRFLYCSSRCPGRDVRFGCGPGGEQRPAS